MINVEKAVEDWLRKEYRRSNKQVLKAAKPAVYRDMVEGMRVVARHLIKDATESPEGKHIICFKEDPGFIDNIGYSTVYAGEDWESYFKNNKVKFWVRIVDLKDLLKLLSLPKELSNGEDKDNNDREWIFR